MPTKNPKVDAFVSRATKWRAEIEKLRSILLDAGLEEDVKWGTPCFMFEGKNIAIMQPFKAHLHGEAPWSRAPWPIASE